MLALLQVWGGLFFLLNKILFWKSERATESDSARTWRIGAWLVYLIGLPAWLYISAHEHNLIALWMGLASIPSMIYGLINSLWRNEQGSRALLNLLALAGAIIGLWQSLQHFDGIHTLTQKLELVSAVGYVAGTYLLAWKKQSGYIGFMVVNSATGCLMFEQGYYGLAFQQVLSLFFVVASYRLCWQRRLQADP